MSKSKDFLNEIANELNSLKTKEEKLETLIFYGKNIKPFDLTLKSQENLVPGCISETYLTVSLNPDNTIRFEGDSSSLITKGYIYIFTQAFSGIYPVDVIKNIESEAMDFIKTAGIDTTLMPSRTNTIYNIYMRMKQLAYGYLA